MTHTPNELDEVFADRRDRLEALKSGDAHFRHLSDVYHTLNREIHRAETDLEPVADNVLEEMKKRRLALLDEIRALV